LPELQVLCLIFPQVQEKAASSPFAKETKALFNQDQGQCKKSKIWVSPPGLCPGERKTEICRKKKTLLSAKD
jgi:hypothetical protein